MVVSLKYFIFHSLAYLFRKTLKATKGNIYLLNENGIFSLIELMFSIIYTLEKLDFEDMLKTIKLYISYRI